MKTNKVLSIVILLIATTYSACSNDDISDRALRNNSSEISPFVVFAGSPDGGKRVHPDSIRNKVTAYFPSSVFEGYSSTAISFAGENIIIDSQLGMGGLPEKSIYKFENDILYIKNSGAWRYIGEGNQSLITIRQHYVGYKQPGNEHFQYKQLEPQKDIDSIKAVKTTPFELLDNMKAEEDTLIWCTRSSIFR